MSDNRDDRSAPPEATVDDFATAMICKQSCPRRITGEAADKIAGEIAGLRKVACCIKGEADRNGRGGRLGLLTLDPNHHLNVRLETTEWRFDRHQKIEVLHDAERDAYRFLLASNTKLGLSCHYDRRDEWDTSRRRRSRSGKDLVLSDAPTWFKVECEDCDARSCWYTIRPMDEADKKLGSSSPAQASPANESGPSDGEWNVTPLKDKFLPPPYPVHLIWRPCERKPATWCFMRV